jgi:hypothetical protein
MMLGMREKRWRVPVIAIICQLLVLQSVFGQQTGTPRNLKIVTVEGEAARNVVQQIPARPMTVRVEDATGRPVPGATVVFTAPESGPSGEFENDSRTIRVMTGPEGVASAGVYHPNATTGSYQVRVTAEFGGETVTAGISQTNIAERKGHGKLIAVLAIAGAAAAAAVLARKKSGSSSSDTPTITFGGAAVGAPR